MCASRRCYESQTTAGGFSEVSGSSTSTSIKSTRRRKGLMPGIVSRRRETGRRAPVAESRWRETIPGNIPFLLHVAVQSGLQEVKAKVPFPQFLPHHGRGNPHYECRCGSTRDGSTTATLRQLQLPLCPSLWPLACLPL